MQFPGTIVFAHEIDLFLGTTVERAKVQITTRIIFRPVLSVSVEDVVNDKVCKSEEQRRYSTRMGNKVVSFE
jgi:hypothetical protein